MTSINIIARNNCKLNVNVVGNYNVALTGVTGPYNIVLLKPGRDYLKIKTHPDTRIMNRDARIKAWEDYLKQLNDKLSALVEPEKYEGEDENEKKKYEEAKKAYDDEKALIEKAKSEAQPKYEAAQKAKVEDDYKTPSGSTGFESEHIIDVSSYEYIKYEQTWTCYVKSEVITTYQAGHVVNLINEMFSVMKKEHSTWTNLIDYIDSYSKFKFTNIDILEASSAFAYLLGIPTSGATDYSTTIPVYNGTPYIFLKCNKLNTALRYCWQTDPKIKSMSEKEQKNAMYSSVQRIISVSPNNNYINQPFSLGGGQFTANGNDLTDVEFTITGINGDELEFASDLLWSFELTPIPDEDLSNLPGLLSQDQQQQLQAQQGEEQQAPNEQQMMMTQEQGQQQTHEQQIVKPSPDGLMRSGLPRVEPIR